MYPHLSGEEAEIGLVLFDSNAEVGPLQPLGIWGETRTPGLFFFVFLVFFALCSAGHSHGRPLQSEPLFQHLEKGFESGKVADLRFGNGWGMASALSLTYCIALGKRKSFSEPQFYL